MAPRRGEVWLVELSATKGREQSGQRPGLVISDDRFNRSRAGLVILIPVTSRARGLPVHVPLPAGTAGLRVDSYAMCEQLRTVSVDRLVDGPSGTVARPVMRRIEHTVRLLLRL